MQNRLQYYGISVRFLLLRELALHLRGLWTYIYQKQVKAPSLLYSGAMALVMDWKRLTTSVAVDFSKVIAFANLIRWSVCFWVASLDDALNRLHL